MRGSPVRAVFSLPLLACALFAQAPEAVPRPLDLDSLLARLAAADAARTAALQQYSSLRRYSLENRRFRTTAEMIVRMTYRHPGTKTFEVISEQGSGAVRKRVLRKMVDAEIEAASRETRSSTRITPENYSFRLLAPAVDRERPFYVLEWWWPRPRRRSDSWWCRGSRSLSEC